MKKNLTLRPICVAMLLVFSLTGCRDGLLDEVMQRKGLAKKVRPDEVIHNGRHYDLTYDKSGFVDRIDVTQDGDLMYTYDATYEDNRLVSAALIEDGAVVSENHDFTFDGSGNITGFTYTWYIPDVPGGVSQRYSFAYDEQGRLISSSSEGGSGDTYTYDAHDNVASITNANSETTYTYDDKLNPLHLIPDLFAIVVEEHFFWEFIFSEHNSVTRHRYTNYNMQYEHTTYTNSYDKFHRLISKVDEEGNGFTFIY